ncbi:Cullin repeat-like-containing domain protein [Mycena galericulata]|nr:Cullin repeat-like-containing domain protein [Mycena galericulata]
MSTQLIGIDPTPPGPVSFRRRPRTRTNIPQLWDNVLRPGVTLILRGEEPLTHERHAAMYSAIANACLEIDQNGDMRTSRELYAQIASFYPEYTTQILAAAPDDDTRILEYYDAEWDRFSRGAAIVGRLFDFLNRHWINRERQEGRKNILTVGNVALKEWNTNVFQPLTSRLETALGTSGATQLDEIRTRFASENLTADDFKAMRLRPV